MSETVIKSAYAKVKATDEFKHRTVELLQKKNHRQKKGERKRVVLVTASIAIFIGVIAAYSIFQKTAKPILPASSPNANTGGSITIPKIDPPKSNNPMASMIGIVVYQGKVYAAAGTQISLDNAKKVMGNKLGTAKGNLDEWSKKDDYSELASVVPGDVYSVKGYDSNFRIMIVRKSLDGTESAGFLECLNGITVSSGKDVFGKLNMKGNAVSLTYVQWCDGQTPIYPVDDESLMNRLIDALDDTTPRTYDQGRIQGVDLDVHDSANARYIVIALKDGSNVRLKLVKGGYVCYGTTVFKMTDNVFDELWDKLDCSKDPSTEKD